MVLSRRERALVFILATIVLAASYYKFLITPFRSNLIQLTYDKEEKEFQCNEMQQKLQSTATLDRDLQILNNEVSDLAGVYFGNLQQEDIILLLNDFIIDSSIRILSINFMEARRELLVEVEEESSEESSQNQPSADIHPIQVNYEGDYEGVINFLKNIREYEKKIIINNLSINNNYNGLLSGDILMDFYTLDEVNKYYSMESSILHYGQDTVSNEDKINNPFDAYEAFIEIDEIAVSADFAKNTEIRKMTNLHGFEDGNIFFVGEPKDVFGKVSLDDNSIEGRYSNKIEYDFIRGREHSVANLVFEGEPIKIKKQPEFLSLSIYPYETNKHTIGIVLIDSKGRQFKVPLTDEVEQWRWNTIEITPPIEITYPAIVQRIYIESNGFSNKLKGHFLFDKLQVLYNDASSFSNDILD